MSFADILNHLNDCSPSSCFHCPQCEYPLRFHLENAKRCPDCGEVLEDD